MSYKDLTSYQLLLDLGFQDESGPIQIKKGVVKFSFNINGYTNHPSNFSYHFDPNYNHNDKIFAKAKRISTFNSYFNIFMKEKNNDIIIDYDLAFLSFILCTFDLKKIKIPTYENINTLFAKNKKKIFEKVFK